MGYLLYCILTTLENQSPGALVGVDGQPVFLVSHNGLSAAISRINQSNVTLEISCILAYQRVVESFHCHPAVGGVIPMRYGSLFEEEPQIIRLLKERCKHYKALLKQLEGCVEMGIRVLVSDSEASIPCPVKRLPSGTLTEASTERACFIGERIENPGCAYLAARKAHYAQQEKFNNQAKEVIGQYRAAFSGLFVKCKTEFPSIINHQSSIFNRQSAIRNPVLSLCFLVQREHIEWFQQVFREINVQEYPKLLLSGPWPPYNFVQPDHIDSQKSIFPSPCE
jgi:hypothetical protein